MRGFRKGVMGGVAVGFWTMWNSEVGRGMEKVSVRGEYTTRDGSR
jgi:hypothetical protein